MKKIINTIGILIISLIFNFLLITNVSAATPHEFTFQIKDYDPVNKTGTGNIIPQGGDVEPGQIIQVDVILKEGLPKFYSMQLGVTFDTDIVEPRLRTNGSLYSQLGQNLRDMNSDEGTNWALLPNYVPEMNGIYATLRDNTSGGYPGSGLILTYALKIKEDAQAGSTFNISFDESYTKVNVDGSTWSLTPFQLNVYGEMSSDNSLGSLSVKNGGQTYSLSPNFVAGSPSVKTYNAIVPNHISSINLEATTYNEYANITLGSLGSKNLNVGNNSFPITVTAQNGVSEIYTVNVYRLSNDATLNSLSFSNGVSLPISFNPNTFEYIINDIAYAVKNTDVTATKNHAEATIVSGSGVWNLTNHGSTPNNRSIIVKAENCKDEYLTVPGNSCTQSEYKITLNRIAPSTNNYLSMIKIDNINLNGFQKATTTYNLDNVPYAKSTLKIEGIVEDTGKATIISGNGTFDLNVGNNIFTILVKAENGDELPYTINVRRKSNDATLSSLIVTSSPNDKLSPDFPNAANREYVYNIGPDVTQLVLTATTNHGSASISTSLTRSGETNPANLGTINVQDQDEIRITVTAEDGNVNVYKIKVERTKSTDATLSMLEIVGRTITPVFNKETTLYSLEVDGSVDKININAAVTDPKASIRVGDLGEKSLNYGSNPFQIRVISEAGGNNYKDYTINVTRKMKTIATLSDLKVNGTTIAGFNPNTFEYNYGTIENDVENLIIAAIATDSDAKSIEVRGNENIVVGPSTIIVTVTAHDGVTKQEYKININRKKSSNAYLSDIKINNVSIPSFNKETTIYYYEVENNVTSLINLVPITETSLTTGTVEIEGNQNFSTKNVNIVKITVTAEDEVTTKEYFIHVTRKKSSNNYLASVNLSNGTLNIPFNKTTNGYNVTVARNIDRITITGTKEDIEATVINPEEVILEVGVPTPITISVTSEDGNINIYTFTVTRERSKNNDLSNILINNVQIEGFAKDKTSYTINRPHTLNSVLIEAVVDGPGATYDILDIDNNIITEEAPITTGNNIYTIRVVSEDGTQKNYVITINRLQSNDNTLKSLGVNGYTILPNNEPFNPLVAEYTLNVDMDVTSITVVGEANDSKNKGITGLGNHNLVNGVNTIKITVLAENGYPKEYTLTVTRAYYNNAYLSNITVNGTSVEGFNKEQLNYTVNVPNSVTTANVIGVKDHPTMIINGGGNIPLKTTEPNIITINTIAQDNITKLTYTITIIRAKNNDTSLKDLRIDGTRISGFEANKDYYELNVPNDTTYLRNLIVEPTKTETKVISITGNESFNTSNEGNEVVITVEAEDGTLKNYVIKVFRTKSSVNTLDAIELSSGLLSPTFGKNKLNYTVEVERSVSDITITPTLTDGASTLEMNEEPILNGESKTYSLTPGVKKTIKIVVTPENGGTKKEYTIEVTRKLSSDATLKSLTINGSLIDEFLPNKTYYNITVAHTIKDVEIVLTPNFPDDATPITKNEVLKTGVNLYAISVTAENGTVTTYNITINRPESNDNYLSNLFVTDYDFNEAFTPTNLKYTLEVAADVESINVNAIARDDKVRSITGTGNINIANGVNNLEIIVTAENGEPRKYEIEVIRDYYTYNKLTNIIITDSNNNNYDLSFNPNIISYILNVANDIESLTFEAIKEHFSETVVGDGLINLVTTQPNIVKIEVKSQSGEADKTTIYTITVNRAKNSDVTLKNITIKGTQINGFEPDKMLYTINVDNNVTSLDNLVVTPNKATTQVVSITGNNDFTTSDTGNDIVITVRAENGNELNYTIKVIRAKSTINDLSNIILSSGLLNPVFNKDTLIYNVSLNRNIENITVTPILASKAASITINDIEVSVDQGYTFALEAGIGKEIIIKVTAEAGGEAKEYKVTVLRDRSNNNNLSSITAIDNSSIDHIKNFNPNVTAYTFTVKHTVNEITLNAVLEDNTAKEPVLMDKDNNVLSNHKVSLVTGLNEFKFEVEAENETKKIYTITINKDKSDNNALRSLSFNEGVLNETFSKDVLEYTAAVGYNITSVTINAIKDDSLASNPVINGPATLKTGENIYTITVTAENNVSRVYTLKIYRDKNNVADLTSLGITGFTLKETFNKDVLLYSAEVPNQTTNITPFFTKADSAATHVIKLNNVVVGSSNLSLNTGVNKLEVIVTSEDTLVTKTYVINITRKKSTVNTLTALNINPSSLDQAFEENTLSYTATVDHAITRVDVNYIRKDSSSQVTITGNENLVVGENTITVAVTAEAGGEPKEYIIVVTRKASPSAYLSNLKALDINNVNHIKVFGKDTILYEITVPNDIDKVTIEAIPEVEGAQVKINDEVVTSKEIALTVDEVNKVEIEIVSPDTTNTKKYTVMITRQKNSNALLETLVVKDKDNNILPLDKLLNETDTNYSVNVDSSIRSVSVEATSKVVTTQVSPVLPKTYDLTMPVTTVTITTTAENGNIRTYLLTINREKSSNNDLTSLTLTNKGVNLLPNFDKDQTIYTLEVENDVSSLDVLGVVADDYARIIKGNGLKPLVVGENPIEIIVAAENDVTKSYYVTVTRKASSNNLLTELNIDGNLVNGFESNINNYSITVENDVKEVTITAQAADTTATVSGTSTYQLSTKTNNKIEVIVTAQNNSKRTYTININRKKSTNNRLKSLEIEEGLLQPTFDNNHLEYNITIPNDYTSLTIDAVLEDLSGTIEIDGNKDFQVGSANLVTVSVVPEACESGCTLGATIKTFIINVTRSSAANNYLKTLEITDATGKVYNLNKTFDPLVRGGYKVKIPAGVDKVWVKAETQLQSSTIISGIGETTITSLPQVHTVLVHSPTGIAGTYVVTFEKQLSGDTNLNNIVLDKGNLTPSFSPSVKEYVVNVESNIANITITPQGKEGQEITGGGLKTLAYGENTYTINITAEDKISKTSYQVKVIREHPESNTLSNIVLSVGTLSPVFNETQLNYNVNIISTVNSITVTPILTNSNSKLEMAVNGEDYQIMTQLELDSLDVETTVKIRVTNTEGDIKEYIVVINKMENNRITSMEYGHTIESDYIKTVKLDTTIMEMKNQLDNDNSYLQIWLADESRQLNNNEKVATGMIVKLIINGIEEDRKYIIVKGDTDGDGMIDLSDAVKVLNHFLEKNLLEGAYLQAGYVNDDLDCDLSDAVAILNHFLEKVLLH